MTEQTFQLTAARRRLRQTCRQSRPLRCFNSQPLEGGCHSFQSGCSACCGFNSQPLEGGCGQAFDCRRLRAQVSTHSRSKAAAALDGFFEVDAEGFNSQPLEGGCQPHGRNGRAARVSTHSRSKAAAPHQGDAAPFRAVSTHSRSKAAALCIKICEKSVNYQ